MEKIYQKWSACHLNTEQQKQAVIEWVLSNCLKVFISCFAKLYEINTARMDLTVNIKTTSSGFLVPIHLQLRPLSYTTQDVRDY